MAEIARILNAKEAPTYSSPNNNDIIKGAKMAITKATGIMIIKTYYVYFLFLQAKETYF